MNRGCAHPHNLVLPCLATAPLISCLSKPCTIWFTLVHNKEKCGCDGTALFAIVCRAAPFSAPVLTTPLLSFFFYSTSSLNNSKHPTRADKWMQVQHLTLFPDAGKHRFWKKRICRSFKIKQYSSLRERSPVINDHLSASRPPAHQNAMNELAGTSEHCKTFRHSIKVYQANSRAHMNHTHVVNHCSAAWWV